MNYLSALLPAQGCQKVIIFTSGHPTAWGTKWSSRLKEITKRHRIKSVSSLQERCWNYTPKLELGGIRAGKLRHWIIAIILHRQVLWHVKSHWPVCRKRGRKGGVCGELRVGEGKESSQQGEDVGKICNEGDRNTKMWSLHPRPRELHKCSV